MFRKMIIICFNSRKIVFLFKNILHEFIAIRKQIDAKNSTFFGCIWGVLKIKSQIFCGVADWFYSSLLHKNADTIFKVFAFLFYVLHVVNQDLS